MGGGGRGSICTGGSKGQVELEAGGMLVDVIVCWRVTGFSVCSPESLYMLANFASVVEDVALSAARN